MIRTETLYKSFGSKDTFITEVIKGVTMTIETGEFVSIVGPSGSGKSTLLNLLSTLQTPTSGKILFDDIDVAQLTPKEVADFRNKKIGFIFQSHHLFPELTVLENTLLPASILGDESTYEDRAINLVDRVGLKERLHYRPSQLSGGQNQRVAIARALLLKPHTIFADEPTGNLDSHSSEDVFDLLKEMNQEEKTTIVMVTHDKSLADGVDRKITILDGQVDCHGYKKNKPDQGESGNT